MRAIIIALLVIATNGVSAQGGRPRANPYLDSLRNEKDQLSFQQLEKKYLQGSEQEMRAVYEYYAGVDKAKSDSLRLVIADRYPVGYTAFFLFRDRTYFENDLQKKENMLLEGKKKFVDQDFDEITGYLVIAYAEARDIPKMKAYLAQIDNQVVRHNRTQAAAEIVMKYDLSTAKEIVKQEIDQVEKTSPAYRAYASTYASILAKEGRFADGLSYAKEAYDGAPRKTASLTQNYAYLLSKNGQHEEALPILEDLVKSGNASDEVKAAFKESYQQINPGKDAAAFLSQSSDVIFVKAQKDLEQKMVSKPAPHFVLTDASGREVSLTDFKGKTILLDFWATWCGPCKKSFPAMQIAVNKYKDDPDVKFLFVHTFDKVSDPLADAKSYLSNNNYTFDLYMDLRDATKKNNPVAEAFGIRAIPTKVLIDGSGQIRFVSTGFNAEGDEAVALEVAAMIELARAN